ncbi:MAG: pyruvate synthase [Deltaproteobacteria bacterium]|nr:MAG: pyruvate synthase [Deltaproteobacteria bacterium]
MVEIRFHGRGGQGAVTSAELLAHAAIAEGKFAIALPSFGPERRGAPVVAFARIDDRPVRIRSGIYNPDVVVVLDPRLRETVDVTQGLKEGGILVINSPEEPDGFAGIKVAWVNATQIAREEIGLPITNTTMLGALLKALAVVELESLLEPFRHRFGKVAEKNMAALRRAYQETRVKG